MKKIIFLLALTFMVVTNSFAVNQSVCSAGPCAKTFNCNNSTSNANPTETSYPSGVVITTGNVSAQYFCDDASSTATNTLASHTDKNHVCSYIKYGGTYTDHNVINCYDSSSSAPINAGLIFLIMAGCGAGFFFLRKNQQAANSKLAL